MDGQVVDTQGTENIASVNPAPVNDVTLTPQAPVEGNPGDLSVSQRLAALFDGAATDGQPAQQQPVQTQEPIVQQPAQPTETLLAGKYKTTEDLANAYQNIQSEFTKKSQTLSEIQKTADTLSAENERLTAQLAGLSQNNGQVQAQPQDQPSGVDYGSMDSQSYLDQFYENPREVLSKTIESIIAPFVQKVEPVIKTVNNQVQQESWNRATMNFLEKNPDMENFKEDMGQYIKERSLSTSDNPAQVLSDAYMYARGMRYSPPQQIDAKAILQDQNFVNENILNNPEIVNAILKKQMEQINSQPVPISIAGQNQGRPAAMPQTKASDMKEAHSLFEGMFGRNLS